MAETHKFSLNGAMYHVVRHGRNEGAPPLLLLHGFTGSGNSWTDHISVFTKNFSVITVDFLGHGRSQSPQNPSRYAMPQVADDILALLDRWQIEHTALLGYSMGGRLALYLACHFPNRFTHLILESSSPGLASQTEQLARQQQDEALAAWIEANGIEPFVARWEALPLWNSQQQLSDDVRQRLRLQRLQNNPSGLANSLRGMGTGAQPSLWQQLPTLHLPTLLLAGELDSKFVAFNQQMAALLPNGRLQIIPNAGHTIHLERPDIFQTAVLKFLGN